MTHEQQWVREAAHYFRQQHDREIDYLQVLCNKWGAYKFEHLEVLKSYGVDDMIRMTIDHTRLLMQTAFAQFSGIIEHCEAYGEGAGVFDDGSADTKPITPDVLESVWSMLRLQVAYAEKLFENLERWKLHDWRDPDTVELQSRQGNILNDEKDTTSMVPGPSLVRGSPLLPPASSIVKSCTSPRSVSNSQGIRRAAQMLALPGMSPPQRAPIGTHYEPNQSALSLKISRTGTIKKSSQLNYNNDQRGTDYGDEAEIRTTDKGLMYD